MMMVIVMRMRNTMEVIDRFEKLEKKMIVSMMR